MGTPHSRLVRPLRSRRLAISLIVLLATYAVVGTLVPQGTSGQAKLRAWAAAHPFAEAIARPLGLHSAYSSLLFLGVVLLLALATAACAVERTRHALRIARGIGRVSSTPMSRPMGRPRASCPVAASVEPAAALAAAAKGLEMLGLRVTYESEKVEGRRGSWGVMGSPAFHWSIVALMLVVAAGQATRAEGVMRLPVGERVADAGGSYLHLERGPLFAGRFTGLELEASDLERHHVASGVDFGAAPMITAYRDGGEIARGRVFPNSPLRVGPLLVHMSDFGPVATLGLEAQDGAQVASEEFLLDRSSETSSGTRAQEFALADPAGRPDLSARIQVITFTGSQSDAGVPKVSRALVQTATVGARAFGPPVVLAVGEAIDLPGGRRLRLTGVRDWVGVSVANDWSVPYLYTALFLAIIGLAVSVLVPARRAIIRLVDHPTGWSLHVDTWHSRRDPTFQSRVEEVVRQALEAPEKS